MCMGCMNNADFLLSGGVLSVAGARVGLRSLLPSAAARWTRRVSDDEAEEFVTSLRPAPLETQPRA